MFDIELAGHVPKASARGASVIWKEELPALGVGAAHGPRQGTKYRSGPCISMIASNLPGMFYASPHSRQEARLARNASAKASVWFIRRQTVQSEQAQNSLMMRLKSFTKKLQEAPCCQNLWSGDEISPTCVNGLFEAHGPRLPPEILRHFSVPLFNDIALNGLTLLIVQHEEPRLADRADGGIWKRGNLKLSVSISSANSYFVAAVYQHSKT
ncbi:hypothetical protein B0H63DRAFT_152958 [Podospora didyma]|uniref:Uncharacterized protein n=1 Tax=Podospora didyma TaxID=330526 RepID=A0AAE0NT26_9PEZI|nr:hypothetical protein B0H63DRAFT_152958 [Podospora didyma]